jgi:hypothetical protein
MTLIGLPRSFYNELVNKSEDKCVLRWQQTVANGAVGHITYPEALTLYNIAHPSAADSQRLMEPYDALGNETDGTAYRCSVMLARPSYSQDL